MALLFPLVSFDFLWSTCWAGVLLIQSELLLIVTEFVLLIQSELPLIVTEFGLEELVAFKVWWPHSLMKKKKNLDLLILVHFILIQIVIIVSMSLLLYTCQVFVLCWKLFYLFCFSSFFPPSVLITPYCFPSFLSSLNLIHGM